MSRACLAERKGSRAEVVAMDNIIHYTQFRQGEIVKRGATMEMLGAAELAIVSLVCLIALLPVAAWVYLYRQGGETRDLVFWAVIIFILPVLGPIAVFFFYRPRAKEKST